MPSCKLQPGPVWVVRLNRQKSNALQGTTCSDWSINSAAREAALVHRTLRRRGAQIGIFWRLSVALLVVAPGGRARVVQRFLRCLSLVANIELLSRGSSCIAAKLHLLQNRPGEGSGGCLAGRIRVGGGESSAWSGAASWEKMMERCNRWRPQLAIGPDVSVASAHRDLRPARRFLVAGRLRLCLWPGVSVDRPFSSALVALDQQVSSQAFSLASTVNAHCGRQVLHLGPHQPRAAFPLQCSTPVRTGAWWRGQP